MSKEQQPGMPNIDFNQIMQSAQQMANNISPEEKERIEGMDMTQMFSHVSDTVFNTMEQGGHKIDPATKSQMKVMSKAMLGQFMEGMEPEKESMIDLGDLDPDKKKDVTSSGQKLPVKDDTFEDLDDLEEVPELRPRVDDLFYNLPVTLEDLYSGKVKKLGVKVNQLGKGKDRKKTSKIKKKLEIPVGRGSRDGQEIRFNRGGNEKYGYESGDIVITLSQNNHEYFERHGSTLYTVKNVSLYESYAAGRGDIKIVLKHLNGSYMYLTTDTPLHSKDGSRKVRNAGMPVEGKDGEFGDLYIRFNVLLPETFGGENSEKALELIEKLFPVLPGNVDGIVYTDATKKGFSPTSSDRVRDVQMEEVTEEDMEQLDYEEESDYSDYSDSEEDDDEYSDE